MSVCFSFWCITTLFRLPEKLGQKKASLYETDFPLPFQRFTIIQGNPKSERSLYSNRTQETQSISQWPLTHPSSLPRFPKGRSKETSPWLQPGKHCAWYWTNAHWNVSQSPPQVGPWALQIPKEVNTDTCLHVAPYLIISYLLDFWLVGFGLLLCCFVFPPQMALKQKVSPLLMS